jgi:hypothetical protein
MSNHGDDLLVTTSERAISLTIPSLPSPNAKRTRTLSLQDVLPTQVL